MPDLTLEYEIRAALGIKYVAGLDEAGRGALAGPVVAAAVILPLDDAARLTPLAAVNDSKQLSAAQRETLFSLIMHQALAVGVGRRSAACIDEIGIIPANAQAMGAALDQLSVTAQFLLIDGRMRLRQRPLPQRSVIRGDGRCLTIAAASIIAKVTRDRLMVAFDREYPRYGFARHKGYGTVAHRANLAAYGPSPIHRHSFRPLRQTLL